MNDRKSDGLSLVYKAGTPAELQNAYQTWAGDYDRDTLASGYCLPFLALSWVSRYVATGAGPYLDAGCGTGLSGPFLKALGYSPLEGLDFSQDMLKLAASRGAYDALTRATLGETLPWGDGYFSAFLATGVFTEGHAPASSLRELCRVTRAGGYGIFTVRESIFEAHGFGTVIDDLVRTGAWALTEESTPFRAFAIDEPDVFVKTYVFNVLR